MVDDDDFDGLDDITHLKVDPSMPQTSSKKSKTPLRHTFNLLKYESS